MQVSPAVNRSIPAHEERSSASRQPADLVYQSVTVAAILIVLGTLWLF